MKNPLKYIFVVLAAVAGAQAAVAQERMLPVPTITIYPGDEIRAGMLRERSFPLGYQPRGAVIDTPLAVVGKTARRTLLPGEAIPVNAVDDPKIVSRGVPTQIVFEEGGLSITAMGSPLQSGGLGEQIRVRNTDTGRIILGTVQADGRIRIGGR
ncbi:flagellar basal body P-ring formation chaperone FlgA [Microvirga flavescens]|uniref:flagellar basal body P-ring formation chaperone FlgA n=1 Tax=Microvirga flavescens TaxID=2249811 RepID=UPI00247840C8|nr:flagellar basal body P-ring formation chaperone FlgA [Microvirga flavescens]